MSSSTFVPSIPTRSSVAAKRVASIELNDEELYYLEMWGCSAEPIDNDIIESEATLQDITSSTFTSDNVTTTCTTTTCNATITCDRNAHFIDEELHNYSNSNDALFLLPNSSSCPSPLPAVSNATRRVSLDSQDDDDDEYSISSSHEDEDMSTTLTLTTPDVICGRDKVSVRHAGNQRFRVIVHMFAKKYQTATTRREKTQYTQTIIEMVHGYGGRFIKTGPDATWQQLNAADIHDKVSHALRCARVHSDSSDNHYNSGSGSDDSSYHGSDSSCSGGARKRRSTVRRASAKKSKY